MSHITSPTAIRLPVEDVVAKAREAGILTVIDGAHTPGQIPLGLDVLGADFYAGNCHKWMCAPKGAGFLHARKDRQHLLQPLVVSWGWKAEDDWLGETPFITLHEWQGTHDISPWLSVPVAIDFMREHDWPAVQRECYELVRYAIERVGLPTMEPHAPNMAAFRLPPCNAAAVKRRLYDDYLVEVPVFVWRDQPLLRVSIQAYNTREDVDRLAEALSTILTSL